MPGSTGRAARALSGSHQSRLSRYQSTVSARPCSKATCGCVAELVADLGDVDRVAQVVARAVVDLLDAVPVGAGRLEQPAGELLVGQLGAAADVVDLAGAAAGSSTRWMPRQWSSTCSQSRTLRALAVQRDRARRRSGW